MPPSNALPSTQPSKSISSDIALGGGPLDRLQLGEAFADALDLALDDLVGGLGLGPADLEALVLAELGRRPHADLEFEVERLALGLGGGDDLDAGSPTGLMPESSRPRSYHSGSESRIASCEDGAEAEPLDHQRGRRLALAEAGQPHLPGQAAGGALHAASDVLGGNLHLDPHPRVGQLCDARSASRRP